MDTVTTVFIMVMILLGIGNPFPGSMVMSTATGSEPVPVPVSPAFIWAAINMSLIENRIPWYCPKVVFHSRATVASFGNPEFGRNFIGIVDNVYVNVNGDGEQPEPKSDSEPENGTAPATGSGSGGDSTWDTAEAQLNAAAVRQIYEKLDPCLIVLSFIFNSSEIFWDEEDEPGISDPDTGHGYDSDSEYQALIRTTRKSGPNSTRHAIRHRLTNLFQYATPVKMRHLMIVRLSADLAHLRYCTKAPVYPVRLVPTWELLLFDFFSEAHVIQGIYSDHGRPPYVKVGKELGKWKWLCEDVMQRLELESKCAMDHGCLRDADPDYYEENRNSWSNTAMTKKRGDMVCRNGYRPRQ